MSEHLTCASFFSGVGGIDIAFEQNGFKTIYANEFDDKACETYSANSKIKIDNRDIRNVKAEEIPDFDVMIAGFPCQAFSIAGLRQGFSDEKGRGTLFFELIRIIKAKQPKIVFLENVKNLVSHDKGRTYNTIFESLKNEGYFVKARILNAKEYGNIPQNRERIYIIAFKDETQYKNFDFPEEIPLTKTLQDVIDFNSKVEDKYYYTKDSLYYDHLKNEMNSNKTTYQWRRKYVRENKSNLCPTLTANMGTGGNNVPLILTDEGIRKLTPKECFDLQGFPKDFILPELANSHLYKQAGNSVAVPVISRIASRLQETI